MNLSDFFFIYFLIFAVSATRGLWRRAYLAEESRLFGSGERHKLGTEEHHILLFFCCEYFFACSSIISRVFLFAFVGIGEKTNIGNGRTIYTSFFAVNISLSSLISRLSLFAFVWLTHKI